MILTALSIWLVCVAGIVAPVLLRLRRIDRRWREQATVWRQCEGQKWRQQ